MDPEQLYQEVLQEEQQKGSSPAVAEGRAKAARQRAIEGSPHPKEPKWWPGAQPQFEGGDAAEAPEEAAPEEAAAEEAPAAEPAAEEAPAAEPAAEEAPAEAPAAEAEEAPAAEAEEAPAAEAEEAPAAEAPAEAQPAAEAPAEAQPAAEPRATDMVPEMRPMGVRHGVAAGTRLRPEDAVASEAQFEGQRAVERRRALIDELIQTGVPAVTAAETDRGPSITTSLVFVVVPLLAVLLLVMNSDTLRGTASPEEPAGGGGNADVTVTAEGTQFDTDQIELPVGEESTIELVNNDAVDHNIAIYESQDDADSQSSPLFEGERVSDTTTLYDVPPLDEGEFIFHCDVHPAMAGTVVVQ